MTKFQPHEERKDDIVALGRDDVLVIITGGTIDSKAYPAEGPPPVPVPLRGKSIIPAALRKLLGREEAQHCACEQWRMKDSNYLTTRELFELADKIRSASQSRILITHGTDAMPRNSRFLQEQLSGTDKIIVMVGAMQPIANRRTAKGSDGLANLALALKELSNPALESGVHVVGRGPSKGPELFRPEELVKNKKELIFERDPKGIYSGVQI